MGWRIDVHGAILDEDNVKAAHVSVVNAALGVTGWDAIDPIASPEALIVWCAVAVSEATGRPLDETMVYIQTLPIREVIGFFTADVPAAPTEATLPPPVVEQPVLIADGMVEVEPGVRVNPLYVEQILKATRG
jgi:hypothetical protein